MSNIKHILRFAAALILAVAAAACSADPGIDDVDMPPAGAVLRLWTGSSPTRAGKGEFTGDDHSGADIYAEYNEELIDRVSLFFYSNDSRDSAPFYACELTNVGEYTVADLSVKIPIELTHNFKENDNKGYVHALVNLPDAFKVDTSGNITDAKGDSRPATLSNIDQLWVQAPEFLTAGVGSFVMQGGTQVLLDGEGRNMMVKGDILLRRLASKIRLLADIPDEIYVNKETGKTVRPDDDEYKDDAGKWEADLADGTIERWEFVDTELDDNGNEISSVKLYLYNLTTRGRLDGHIGSAEEMGYAYIDRNKNYEKIIRRLSTDAMLNDADKDEVYKYSHSLPYYSYPNAWDSTTPTEEHQTYVILALPWKREQDGAAEYENYYYQIPVNALNDSDKSDADRDRLDPNRYYRIKLHVGMLGSRDLGTPLEIDSSCEVVDWCNADVDVNIKERRYLVVNQTNWTMNNVWTLEIPFSTSHETEVVACYITYFRYNDIWGTSDYTNGEHNATEFNEWLLAAQGDEDKGYPGLTGGQDGEGLITAKEFQSGRETAADMETTRGDRVFNGEYRDWGYVRLECFDRPTTIISHQDTSGEQQLYYKKKYFYDDVINNYFYYVGREHPKTYQLDYLERPADSSFQDTEDINGKKINIDSQKWAWELYNDIYGINSIYTCDIDNENGLIRIKHPLVWWEEVRSRSEDYTEETRREEGTYSLEGRLLTGYYWVRDVTTYVTRTHTMDIKYYRPVLSDNGLRLRDEFSRCEIIIKIKHKDWSEDSDLYNETIHITQYPAVYVQESHNYGNISTGTNGRYSGGNQYVRINGKTTYNGSNTGYWEVGGDGAFGVTNSVTRFNGTNMNPNMYVVSISQLSDDDEESFDLGDPRSLTNNINLSDASFGQTPNPSNVPSNTEKDANKAWTAWEMTYPGYPRVGTDKLTSPISAKTVLNGKETGTSRSLEYYYPTDETEEGQPGSKENFVAPVIRIASSFGKIQSLEKFEARRRCASYQEAGRPAGRWRLPTKAEVKYIAQLSADGKIPILFGLSGRTARYWTSTGVVLVDANLNVSEVDPDNNKEEAVRCVYDDWYWLTPDGLPDLAPNAPRTDVFYWGDRQKDNTQTPNIQALLKPKEVIANE